MKKKTKVWIQTSFLTILEASVSQQSCQPKCEKSSQTQPPKQSNTTKARSSESASSTTQSRVSVSHTRNTSEVIAVNDYNRAIGEDHVLAKYTNAEVDAVIELREEGYSLAKIARMTEIPIRTIRGYLDGTRRCQQPTTWRKRD